MFATLALPYFREVVRFGIVDRFSAEEACMLFSWVCKSNVVSADFVEHTMGLPPGSPKAVELQIDLIFAILTEQVVTQPEAAEHIELKPAARSATATVATLTSAKQVKAQDGRAEQLETENRHLKQLIGNLSLEKKLLLERLAAIEPATPRQ